MTVIHTCRLAVGLFALLCAGTATAQINRMDVPTGSGPVTLLAQDWTDIGLITADDNWSGVPGIVGYRGDGMAGGTAANPQTLLADGSGTPIDVIANQLNPNTLTTGGIAEFHLPDPVPAFQGSGTARAPHLVLTVNTTGLTQIDVSYLLRDIDGSGDNSVQPVATQYRVGTSGNYTNLPAGFVADASSGPGQATLVTPVSVILPADAENQPVVQVRIITTDAIGSDEWIGVDDILITAVAPGSNTPPTVDAGGPYTVETTGTITLDGTVVDPDTGDTLVVTWSIVPTGPTFSDPAEIDPELNGNGAAEGDYVLTLTVDDGSGPVSDTAALTVADTQPPIEDVLYINEVHYDNTGTDVGEFIELAGTAGLDLSSWSLVLYNGANGQSYSTVNLGAFALPDQDNSYGTVAITYPVNGIQNGNPDAMALVDGSTVVQFLSYGGVFAAANGPAAGLTSQDIGVSQTGGAPIGSSLQLIGSGTSYADFTWTGPVDASPGQVNAGQSIGGGSPAFPPVAQCPGTFGVAQGVGGTALLGASDPDDQIVAATIVAGTQPGIGLIDFVASPAVGEDATVVLQVAGSVALGSYPTTVRFTNDGAPQSVDCVVNVTVVASAGVVPISQVQGSGTVSPLAGQSVTVTAVVTSNLTGDLQGNQMGGFYIEEEQADRDADPATSEGIFVFAGAQSPSFTGLSVGDVVTVTGVAEEYFTQTQINASTGTITATGATATLPLPFPISALPDSSAAAFAATFEPLEGMRVQLADTWTVAENFELHRLGELQLVPGTQPLQTATNIGPPGPEAGEFESDTQTEPRTTSLTLDDARNGILSPANFDTPYVVPDVTGTLRRGSTIDDLVAIMAFDFGRYRLRPVDDEANIVFTPAPRPAVPAVGGDVVVATFNVLNYFNGDGMGGGFPTSRGAETFAEFQRQTEKIVAALIELDADVVGLIEIENDGDAAIPSVRTLTEALNGALGVARYDYLVTGGRIGGDEIAQAYIYDTTTMTLDGFAILDNVDPFNRNTRPPLAGRFTEIATGETFVAIVNHFKSKGTGSGPGNGNAGDGQALSNADRVLAAAELIDWVDTHAFFAADDRVLVIGDINAYAHEDPIVLFEDAGYVDLQDGQTREAYTYTFFGAEGRLDYALANPAALEVVTATAAWHINSDEPRGKDYTFFNQAELYEPGPYRSSDHDPVVIGLNLAGDPPVADSIRITEWMYDGAGGEFVELTNTGAEAIDVTGWSYDDDSATPGGFDLSGFGVIEAGESVVFVESDPAAFRSEWSLCAGANVIGPYTNNLGRADQINIFDAAGIRVDRLTYGDQAFPGSIRTQNASGWVSAAGLGADDVFAWTLSSIGDAESSVASVGGAIGSPGTSTRASVAYNPCGVAGPALIEKPLVAGDDHSCGIKDGIAYCWGIDSRGQLGNGAELTGDQQLPTPVDVSGLPAGIEWIAVDAADLHSCGLTTDGAIYCWGGGYAGALGAGPAVTGDQLSPVAVDVSGLPAGTTFVDLAVGEQQTCAISSEGDGYCWGSGGPGQLGIGGDGATVWVPTSIDISAMPAGTKWKRISTGSIHTCGVTMIGDAYCWGNPNHGRLGNGDNSSNAFSPDPVEMSGLPAGTLWDSVIAGDNHTCGLTTEGVIYCWGRDNLGQLGNGGMASGNNNPLPLPLDLTSLPGGTTWSFVETGDEMTCALTLGGQLYCWGAVPGFGTFISPAAVDVSALPTGVTFDHVTVATSASHVCARSTAGVGYCWGTDPFGQLGNGAEIGNDWIPNTPIAYPGGPTPEIVVSTIAAGLEFACGLDSNGIAYCWGRDSVGQLGNGSTVTTNMVSPYPVDMSALPAGTRFASITAGGTSACALTFDGAVYCWGQDNYGQLGNGDVVNDNQHAPVAVDMAPLNGAMFVSLSAARTHACGVADDGIGYCWGRESALGLPPGVTGNQFSPSPVDMALLPAGVTLSSISAAVNHGCAVASNGGLYCWGQNSNGVLGIGTSGGSHPITAVNVSALPAGTTFAQVTTGDSHSCALTTDDVAYCWGAGINGAVGNGAQSLDILLPNPVVTSTIPAGTYFTVLEGGGTNTCGILNTGAAYCWGFGNWGALGTGDGTSRYSPHPVATTTLPADTVFTELSADNNLTCAATQAGEFYCWGRDDQGQQGNGPVLTTDPSLLPTPVFPFVPVEGLPPSIVVANPIVVGSVGDPTNIGTTLTIADPDTDIADLVIEVTTANASVIVPGAVTLTGDGAQRQVAFAPIGRGLSNVTFIVTDPEGNGQSATLQYASSNQAPDPSGRYHHHISDASAALDVGDGYSILLNDETNTIFLHRDDTTGLPVKTWSFNSGQLGTSSEIDFEGITRFGDQVLLTGSHGNSRNGPARPERRTFVAATISGSGADTELVFQGRYNNLWSELRTWDQSNGHGLGADALGFIAGTAPGVLPNPPGGFNIEGMAFSADGETVYLAFRAPTINIDGTYRALIVPLLNVEDLINGTPGTGPAQFGAPLLVDLGGRSIRDMASNAEGDYLISAGPSPQNDSWALYTWNGNPNDAPQFNRDLPAEDLLTGGTWEAIGAVPHPMVEGATVRLITDSGDSNFYGTGATKDLAQVYQKSYTQAFALAEVPGGEPAGGIRITEWMYDGAGGEFVELTNTGTDAVDVTGWSYDDDSATPGGFDLSGLGVIEAGESVVFVESDPATFRGEWNLCPGIKIIGPYTNNLGRGDQINIFDAAGIRVDRLTYGDQAFPGSIRTQNASGWVSAAGLGADDVFAWTLSSIGDAESSVASVGGAIGSPGTSARASVPYEPCGAIVEHTLVVDILGTGLGTITGDGIACPGDCEEAYLEGTQVILTASATSGFVFDGWTGACTGTGECQVTMDAAKAVDATFITAASIAIEPASLSSTLVTGSNETQVLTLANSGEDTLDWQLTDAGDCAVPAWIDVDPVGGAIEGGGNQAVDVSFDAAGLAPAVYEATLCIASNDPEQSTVNVPVSLTVTAIPVPVLTFDPKALDFGAVEVGATSPSLSATLRNDGNAEATDLSFSTPGSGFAADVSDCGSSIPAGESCDVVVSFTPTAAGDVDAVFEVESVDGASAALELQGSGVPPPDPQTDLAVTIEAEQTHVQRGELVDYLITVSNIGPDTATAASVASTLSSALDTDFAEWVCVGPAASGCTESGQGDLVDTGLTIPAGEQVSYLISAPVRADADGEISTQVQALDEYDVDPANNAAEAVGQVVVFRDGFESGSEGTPVVPLTPQTEPTLAGETITLIWPARGEALIETVLMATPEGAGPTTAVFRLERLNVDLRSWVRLVAEDDGGGEYASHWLPVAAEEELNLVVVDAESGHEAHGDDVVHQRTAQLLFAADVALQLPLFVHPSSYRVWSTVPLVITSAADSD